MGSLTTKCRLGLFIALQLWILCPTFGASYFYSRLQFDDNVYQTKTGRISDFSIRLATRYIDSEQNGLVYLEGYGHETSLNNIGAEYFHQLASTRSGWAMELGFLLQQYLNRETALADENVDLAAIGVDASKSFRLANGNLKVVPETYLYSFSGASNRYDLRPAVGAEYDHPLSQPLKLLAGANLIFNLSSDKDYSSFKTILSGGVRYTITDSSELTAKATFSNTSYLSRFGTNAPIYNNRGRIVGAADQSERVQSTKLSISYENQISLAESLGCQLIVFSQTSVSELLDYNSNVISAWYSKRF